MFACLRESSHLAVHTSWIFVSTSVLKDINPFSSLTGLKGLSSAVRQMNEGCSGHPVALHFKSTIFPNSTRKGLLLSRWTFSEAFPEHKTDKRLVLKQHIESLINILFNLKVVYCCVRQHLRVKKRQFSFYLPASVTDIAKKASILNFLI